MARISSKSARSPSLPLIPLFLAAAVLTALGAISHSISVPGLFSKNQSDEWFVSKRVDSNPYRDRNVFKYSRSFNRTKYTFDSFVVAGGIDLAGFGLDNDPWRRGQSPLSSSSRDSTFELFEDFDLSRNIQGNETWIELLEYRRDATHPSLSFYVDKVAFKRWLVVSYPDLEIDGIESYLLKYASELEQEAELKNSQKTLNYTPKENILVQELLRSLPTDVDYAAKPTHLSCSGGVWLVHKDKATNTTYVGNGKKKMKAWSANNNIKSNNKSTNSDERKEIAQDLSSNLQKVQEKCGRSVVESYALRHVRPGIVVEERFTQPTTLNLNENENNDIDDNENSDESFLKGGMEFKVFTIWGRAWVTVWRPGTDGVKALFCRNGTNLIFDPPIKKNQKSTASSTSESLSTLPDWLDWNKVISIAEKLGRHKDMFRTDVFVGVSSGRNSKETIRYVVSETEIHPTPLRGFETVFEEAGRLWLAGYYYLFSEKKEQRRGYGDQRGHVSPNFRVVPNTEVPRSFYQENDYEGVL